MRQDWERGGDVVKYALTSKPLNDKYKALRMRISDGASGKEAYIAQRYSTSVSASASKTYTTSRASNYVTSRTLSTASSSKLSTGNATRSSAYNTSSSVSTTSSKLTHNANL